MRTGTADLPLHGGRAPAWLMERMIPLSREIALAVIAEEGAVGFLRRLSDPFWFQALGCVLGFDWHSSGLTTTACGALKGGLKDARDELGLVVAGGKGGASRRTPDEIRRACEVSGQDANRLVLASRLSAKVDSSAVQDGFQVYHHTFLFIADGTWAVVQQGMNEATGMARRYHWLTPRRFDADPHSAVAGVDRVPVLNLVAGEAEANRSTSVALAREGPEPILHELERMRALEAPHRHDLRLRDLDPERLRRVLLPAYERQPEDFTALLSVRGLGAKGLRALALVAELAYGQPVSVRDPFSFSWAHGGKDGFPYPVDRALYDSTIQSLRTALAEAKAGRTEKVQALKRLGAFETAGPPA